MKTFFSNANITSMTSGLFSMLLVWMLFHAGIEGAQADTAGGNLPSPGTIALLQPEDEESIALGKLIQQSKLEQLYSTADTMLDYIHTLKGEVFRLSDLNRHFWVISHVASAPTFHLDYDEHTENTFDESMDYEVKLNIQYDMEKLSRSPESVSARHPIDKKSAAALLAQYSSAVVLAFRKDYNKDLKEKHRLMVMEYDQKEAVLKEEYAEKEESSLFNTLVDKRINFENKIIIHEIRNNKVQQTLQNSLERIIWLTLLLQCCPEQPAAVKRYIRNAGYEEKEIPALLHRTVGKTKNTEFLYDALEKSPASPAHT